MAPGEKSESEVFNQALLEQMLRSEFKLYRPSVMLYATTDWQNLQATGIVPNIQMALISQIYELLGDLMQALDCNLEALKNKFSQSKLSPEQKTSVEINDLFQLITSFFNKTPDPHVGKQLIYQVIHRLH